MAIYTDKPEDGIPCGCVWRYRLTGEGDWEGTIESCDTHNQIAVRRYNELIAAQDEARKYKEDAERYRWLTKTYFSGTSAFALIGPTRDRAEMDEAIDAARKGEK